MTGVCMFTFCFNILGSLRITQMFDYALKNEVHTVLHLSRSLLDSAK